MRLKAAAAVLLAALVHAAAWPVAESPVEAPSVPRFQSLSLTPYDPFVDTSAGGHTDEARVRSDLAAVSRITDEVRTYSSTRGMELVPRLAAEHGLKVKLGIWLDKDRARNEEEIASGIAAAKGNPSVTSVIVGNEVLLRGDLTVPELVSVIRRVRKETGKPVTTGDIWGTWLNHPELAEEVDYVAAHALPYWDGVTAERAAEWGIETYGKLKAAYPGKKVVIAEFGWPSAGQNRGDVFPDPVSQARIIREFASRAGAAGIAYNIVEAIDQPWKVLEGSVGPNWGVLDADRKLKFPLQGPIETPLWRERAANGLAIALFLSIPVLLMRRPRFLQAALAAAAANGVGAWLSSASVEALLMGYSDWAGRLASVCGLALLALMAVTSLARIGEILSCLVGRGPERLLPPPPAPPRRKVSIHIPACREPSGMLVATLDSVAALRDADFECIVVVNNTPDGADKDAVRDHCASLGERFVFIDAGDIPGFKAGALNVALSRTAPDAEVVAVLDADYVVDPDWLARTLHGFDDPSVGIVQAPQEHRDGGRSRLHSWMNAEYAGFFDVGMVERNEIGAIVVHGTMCLIRRSSLEGVGGWPDDTICEDTDLGLTLAERGWRTLYTRERLGRGLLPDSYESFRRQRHRWAFGGVQIALKHARAMLSRGNGMTLRQRAAFVLGWTSWMGCEALGALLAFMNIGWATYVLNFPGAPVPSLLLTVPLAVAIVLQFVHFHLTYAARVDTSFRDRLGASAVALSLQSTVARAVAEALVLRHMPFVRTAKGGRRGKGSIPYLDILMAAGLVTSAWMLASTNWDDVVEVYGFAAVVALQSLPFLAASAFGIAGSGVAGKIGGRIRGIRNRLLGPPAVAESPSQ